MNAESEKGQERRLRQLAKQLGYELEKDRPEGRDMEHQGGYKVVNADGAAEAGEHFELTLDDVERFLTNKDNPGT
jgi:hypothetical protein